MHISLGNIDISCVHVSGEEVAHAILHFHISVLCRWKTLAELLIVKSLLDVGVIEILPVHMEVLR